MACLAGAAHAGASDDAPMMRYLGFSDLLNQYGAQLADGSNVHVSLVESRTYPVLSDKRFDGKTLTRTSLTTEVETTSGHATNVAARFFGNRAGYNQRSVVTNIPNVQLYSYHEFNGPYLKSPGTAEPYGSPNQSRVGSHAYGDRNESLDSIARLDYLVQRDDFVHVVDAREYSTQGNSFNSIVITPAQGTDKSTTPIANGGAYSNVRVSPVLTGPLTGSGSDAIGQVAGVTALLISRGKTTRSHYEYRTRDTVVMSTITEDRATSASQRQSGYVVRSGETSEVIKAALMAGALRKVEAFDQGGLKVPAITDYRVEAKNRSDNGLDRRYGAGMVNVLNSYRIIDAGEFDSAQDSFCQIGGGIGTHGFDYDPAFGGLAGSNRRADYAFIAGESGEFVATLVWNLRIRGAAETAGTFDASHQLHHLSLILVDVSTGQIVARSASMIDNTQTVRVVLRQGHHYRLTVSTADKPFNWDYGLAWRSARPVRPVSMMVLREIDRR